MEQHIWTDNLYNALLLLQDLTPKGSQWMSDDHPYMKHQRYLERMEKKQRRPRKERRR